jgi:hypothetical protein
MGTLGKSSIFLCLFMFLSAQGLAQHIDSVNPVSPLQGGSIEILGSGFAAQQGAWRVYLYHTVKRQPQDYSCPVLSWSSSRILVEVPADVRPSEYVLKVVIPEQLGRMSNGIRLTVRWHNVDQPPPSRVPWITRLHVTVQSEL